ncbi:MAG: NAD(P)/FAD-dependent oxidoreductase [Clostridia bacterium]|nr:NAD(P)/FAD-dependent oxidoreductase [Clostridia bacterium]
MSEKKFEVTVMRKYNAAVVGGCAAGMTAAINAKRLNPELNIVIIEKLPRIGKKILATGNGRCNMTNLSAVASDYKNADFVEKVFEKYPPEKVVDFFESTGLLTYADSESRVYPRSNMAASVLDSLRFEIEGLGIDVICDMPVSEITKKNGGFEINREILCEKLIIATGGKSSPSQGSDGSGYSLAKQLGHSVTKLYPSLVPLTVKENVKPLKGVRARNVELTLKTDREIKKTKGELLFTDGGISGIAAMELAAAAEELLERVKQKTFTSIDFLPDMNLTQLIDYMLKLKDIKGYCSIDMLFSGILPKSLGIEICKACSLYKQEKKIARLNRREIINLAEKAKSFELEITGTKGFANAQVTSGGVSIEEINPETMESVICKGLYFAGEIIDVDAPCGGYNLQWAFASGLLAGENI